jgi:hypothetical protein
VDLSNEAAAFLGVERLSSKLYQLVITHSMAVGTYQLDITAKDLRGENLSQKTIVRVNVLVGLFLFNPTSSCFLEHRSKSPLSTTAL